MNTTFAGNPAIQELPSEFEGDYINSIRRVRRFVGRKDDLLGLVPFFHAPGVQWNIAAKGDLFFQLTVRYGDADDGTNPDADANVTTLWSLDGNDLEKSLWDHPMMVVYRDALLASNNGNPDPDILAELRGLMDGTLTWNDVTLLQPTNQLIAPIINMRMAGVESYQVSQYVLRRTTIVPATYTSKWPTTNVGKQYTSAALEVAEAVPPTLMFNLPDGVWLKKAPTIQTQQNGSYQIENEWWQWDSLPLLLYPKAT